MLFVEIGAFREWLRRLPGFEAADIESVDRVQGGASNLTYRLGIAGGALPALALRLQRDAGIFQPYDVIREGRVIEALGGTAIPVPRLVGVEQSRDPLGAPFIVLEWIDAPHMGIAGPEASFTAFTNMVAAIHAVDWRRPEFAFLDPPPDASAATLGEISAVQARIEAFGLDEPILLEACERLRLSIPEDGELAFCQGDINVFNYLFRNREIVGVVDWEQARVGDRRSDIGQLVALAHLKGAPFAPPRSMPFVQGYEAATGREWHGLEFFRAFWFFQLAFIHRAWTATGGDAPWYTWDEVMHHLSLAMEEVG